MEALTAVARAPNPRSLHVSEVKGCKTAYKKGRAFVSKSSVVLILTWLLQGHGSPR